MPKNKSTRTVFTLALVLFCANLLLLGQTTTGGITGFVKDPSGSVIPGAKVTLTNQDTGVKLQAVTNNEGIYTFPGLQVGTYSVLAASSGFASQERTGLLVNANEIVSADMQLAVGSAQTLVEVSSTTPPIIDTQTSTLTSVIPNAVLEKMPELTWQHGDVGVYGVVFYSPGVVMPGVNHLGVSGSDTGSSPPISGARQLDTMDTMDGMTVMAYVDNEGGGPVQPSRQAIQEIHTVLANAPAEFWRTAALTVVTKTGTNQFHGSLFEDYNGSVFNARSYFTNKVPFRVYNNFGGAIGGPIIKNKLFFFFDYEGSRESSQVPAVANVPLPAWRTGNFSSFSSPIINPYTGKPFVGNQIPANMISPVSTSLVNFFYPLPNFGAPGLLSGNFQALENADTGYTVFNHYDASINWNIKDKDTLFVRGSYRLLPRVTFGSVGIGGTLPCCSFGFSHRLGASGVVEETHIFSSTLLNEFRFGFTDMRNPSYGNVDGQAVLAQAGLAGALVPNPGLGFPAFTISGLSAVPGRGTSLIRGLDYEWNDNLSWTRGRHSLKFGFDQIFDTAVGYTYPSTIFGGYTFNGKFTGNGFADLLLGLPQQTMRSTPPPNFDIHGILLGAYAQDQYKVNERLTLNYGLRYEYQAPYYSTNGLMYGFDPKTGAVVVADQSVSKVSPFFPSSIPVETAQVAGYPSNSMMFGHKLNFYPRAGFNYLLFPGGSTVLRGGFGLYANNIYGQAGIAQGSAGGPFIGSATYTNAFVNGAPIFSFPNPYLSSGAAATETITVTNPHVSLPYTEQWNLTVEQKLSPTISLTLGYVGTYSSRLLYPSNFNQPPPSTTPYSASELLYPKFHAVNWNVNGGTANYNALQISASKNYGHNAFFSTGLTWAKDLTDDLDSGSFNGSAPQNIYCLTCEYGNNGLTRKITSYINSSYVLPVGRGQHFLTDADRWVDSAVGGWSVAFIGVLTSGNYFAPYVNTGFDTANTNTSFTQRPDQIANPQVSSRGIKNWFNINAYAIPGCPASDPHCAHSTPTNVGRFGTASNGSLVGPNFINFNMSVSKEFHLWEQATLQLRVNATDVFNHANYDIPDQFVTDGPGVAGVITALSAANLSQATSGARQLAFGGRFTF